MADYGAPEPMPGLQENVKIRSHRFGTSRTKGTPYFEMECELQSGYILPVVIWMTEKSMGMARRALKLCGFDPDANSLEALEHNSRLLSGVRIPLVDVEVNDYGVRGSVSFDQKVDMGLLRSITSSLRSAKKTDSDEPAVSERGPAQNPDGSYSPQDDVPF